MAFKLTSTAFQAGGTIPKKFTCDGPDLSPGLAWTDPPAGTQSLSLIMDDPDAPVGTWVHWVLYDLPASASELPENVPKENELSNGARQGRNDFRKIGYGGPCPPEGHGTPLLLQAVCPRRKDHSRARGYKKRTWKRR